MNDLKTIANLNKLNKFCDNFQELATDLLEKTAAKKEKKKGKKIDPKAKTRNRGDVVFPAGSAKVKDNKDHFEVNTEAQCRAALSYAGHYSKAPPWYSGSLEELKAAIRRKVKSKCPNIDVSEPKKKKKSAVMELANRLVSKGYDLIGGGTTTTDPASFKPEDQHFNGGHHETQALPNDKEQPKHDKTIETWHALWRDLITLIDTVKNPDQKKYFQQLLTRLGGNSTDMLVIREIWGKARDAVGKWNINTENIPSFALAHYWQSYNKSAVMELANRLVAKAQAVVAPEIEKTVQYLLTLLANPSKALKENNKPLISRYFAFSEDAKNHQIATWLDREHDTLLYTLEDLKYENATDPLHNIELVLQGLNVYKGSFNPEFYQKMVGVLNYLHDHLMKMMPAKPAPAPAPAAAPAPRPIPGGTPAQTPKNFGDTTPTTFSV